MLARKLIGMFFCVLGIAVAPANAQQEARIRVVIPSLDQAEEDLKWLVELSPNTGLRKQWKTLKEDFLDAFTQGVDLTQPASVDIVFRKDGISKELRIPIKDLTGKSAGFLPSLEGMGFKIEPRPAGNATFFTVTESKKKPFFIRYEKKYAWTSPVKEAIPANLPPATKDMQPLLGLKKDIAAELKNDAEGLKARRDNFQGLRKELEALIKPRRNEDPNAFELRKLSLIQQLNEAERFVVEAEELLATWETDEKGPKHSARGEFSLTALPGTDLEKSLEEFATKPSYFANVTLHPEPLMVGRITFPLDAIRKAHAKEFYKLVRPPLEGEIGKRSGKSDTQKTAMKKAMNLFFDMLDAGADQGVLDAFVDAHPTAPGKNVLICGIRAADGKKADEIVKMLPEIQADWTVKLDSQKHADVSIHEVTIPKSRQASFQKIFKGETVAYVGTSKDAVWGAAGTDAITHLKAAIDEAAKPAPEKADPVFITYQVQVAKLVTLMEIVEKEAPAGNAQLNKEEKQRLKDLERYRKLAQEAMNGCNSLMTGEAKRNDKKIEGHMELNQCVLQFVGSVIADAVKQLQ